MRYYLQLILFKKYLKKKEREKGIKNFIRSTLICCYYEFLFFNNLKATKLIYIQN
jgi:hypothetical protein